MREKFCGLQFLMNEKELVNWLGNKINKPIKTLDEVKNGRDICYYLILLTGQSGYAKQVTKGSNPSQRATNFKLAKSLYGSELNLPFPFVIGKLADGDEEELIRLLENLTTLQDENEEQIDDMPLDELLDYLQDDLTHKLSECKEYRNKLDYLAKERDFYLNKLIRASDATKKHPKEDVETLLNVLTLPHVDFLPKDTNRKK